MSLALPSSFRLDALRFDIKVDFRLDDCCLCRWIVGREAVLILSLLLLFTFKRLDKYLTRTRKGQNHASSHADIFDLDRFEKERTR
jgi:hypothetical protein